MALFRGKRDREFVKRINRELLNHVIDQRIIYFPVSKEFSEVNFYGEAKEKTVDPPVEMNAYVEWKDQDVTTNEWGQDIIYYVDIYVLNDELDRSLIDPIEGDFIEYGADYFEITAVTIPKLIYGKENDELGKKMSARSVRESTFKINVSGSPVEPERTVPDEKGDLKSFYNQIKFPWQSGST